MLEGLRNFSEHSGVPPIEDQILDTHSDQDLALDLLRNGSPEGHSLDLGKIQTGISALWARNNDRAALG